MSNLLVAMMGLPRSGKSTIAKELAAEYGWPIVNKDAIRLAVTGQAYQPAAEPLIKVMDIYMIKSLFGAGHEVVICDETNYSKDARNHLKDSGWTTVFYPVMTDPKTCQQRAKDTDQEYLLPVIEEMYNRYTELDDSDFRYAYTTKGRLIFKMGTYESSKFLDHEVLGGKGWGFIGR